MDPVEGTTMGFPTDVFVEILTRLPPNSRRRFRLVCRLWRDVVDERTATNLRNRAKTLVATDEGSVYVLDDQSPGGLRMPFWNRYRGMRVVGTCNGLLCLCDDRVPGGAITVANPFTGETLDVPPLPLPPSTCAAGVDRAKKCNDDVVGRWHEAYGFAYHPTTGRYKVVHVPCRFTGAWEFRKVQAFTLGEASWRDVAITVPAGATRCDLSAGIVVGVNGTAYWATVEGAAAETIMAFDLEDERVAPVRSPPSMTPSRSGTRFLTEVHGKLGVAFRHSSPWMDSTEVWVMEGPAGGEQERPRWCHWYSLQVYPPRNWSTGHQRLMRPHFAHGGEHVLTWGGYVLYKHRPSVGDTTVARRGVVEISERNPGTVVACIGGRCECEGYYRSFAYVETREPLSVYRLDD